MIKINNDKIEIGKEYICRIAKPNSSNYNNCIEGIYKVKNIYTDQQQVSSPTSNIGGIEVTLSVYCTRTVELVSLDPIIVYGEQGFDSNNEINLENSEIFIQFFEFNEKERHIQERRAERFKLETEFKDKEINYRTKDIFSLGIVLDIRYSETTDNIYFIIMDCHLDKIEVFNEYKVSFFSLEEPIHPVFYKVPRED